VGVFHPPVVRNSAKLLSTWRKMKRKALLMEFLARNYGGTVAKYLYSVRKNLVAGREVDTNVGSWRHFIFIGALLLRSMPSC
jgi:hypothetical protein